MRRLLRGPRSLSARLVATAVLLVAAVGLLVSVTTALVMNSYLTNRLDADLRQNLSRDGGGPARVNRDFDFCPTGGSDRRPPGEIGTLAYRLTSTGACGYVIDHDGDARSLDQAATTKLTGAVRGRGEPTTVDLGRLGSYRVLADSGSDAITGLPTTDVTRAVRSLVLTELALTLAGVALAALAGRRLVDRQLRPLHGLAATAYDVTAMPLHTSGESIRTRVPAVYADPVTEVGQLGSAMNTLLDHVDDALAARHRSEQQVRQFVADASHELRTPLATIQGYAELSRRTPDDMTALGSSMEKVETEAGRMSALVEDLLLLARLDAGRPLERAPVDLTHLVLEAGADARVIAPDHRFRLDLPDEPVSVVGDEQRLHQVVTNLINNAVRHTPPGCTVTLGVRPGNEPGSGRITVHDDGPGISEELRDRVFERFTRGDSSRTRESGGAGLGLSLVQAIVDAHGGRTRVVSESGSTTFSIDLP